MIPRKNKEEIEVMRQGGKRFGEVLDFVLANLKPGLTTEQIDSLAEKKILSLGGKPSFKMVPGYKWSTCLTINEEVVHGLPSERKIKEGDLVGVDVGMFYQGFHTDMARTLCVRTQNSSARWRTKIQNWEEKEKFLEVGKRALEKAIEAAKVGNHVGAISSTIQEEIEKAGYSPVKALTGHGVGRKLHEEPSIPCFLPGKEEKTPKLEEGMVLAIEVIYNQGASEVVLTSDGWTISTQDGKISGLFEETVGVIKGGPLRLTK